ncbi:MAG TPA: transketolase [Candidatus Salinicoccus stercoripullorum]|uniref:Pyruvate dehydrogenase E1 component subunit beta n=1 Tax=Candidatus Salinicoccus stercoripullorum TaxID=2838756 RepID=A0A9D1TZE2_9STAP|nr:transketolase [Candidatus Salinicoccus stercoripullorum]
MAETTFHKDTWELYKSLEMSKQLTSGVTLEKLADEHAEIVAMSSDLSKPTGLWPFAKAYPDRFFNFGLAEKNMVTAAAGMASAGKMPFVSTYASFLGVLAAENIRTAVAYPNLNVRLIGTHTGIAMGFYGTSHHATEDISITRAMANMTVISPADGVALAEMIEESVKSYDGPIYFRVSRGREEPVYEKDGGVQNKIGKANILKDGTDLTIIACGIEVQQSLAAAEQLKEEGINARVIDMHTIKPMDVEAVMDAAAETGTILTVEEHNIQGGLGSAVAEVLMESGISCNFKRHGFYDENSLIGKPYYLYKHYKLDGEGIASVAKKLVER